MNGCHQVGFSVFASKCSIDGFRTRFWVVDAVEDSTKRCCNRTRTRIMCRVVVSFDPASKVASIVIGIVGSVVVSVDPASKVVSIVIVGSCGLMKMMGN